VNARHMMFALFVVAEYGVLIIKGGSIFST